MFLNEPPLCPIGDGMDAHKNLIESLIVTPPNPATTGTSLTITTGQGTLFPTVPFNITIWKSDENASLANAEIVRVTNIVGDVLTMTRAQESSTARTIVAGDKIALTITAKSFTDIEENIDQPVKQLSSPEFLGLYLADFTGVLYSKNGVITPIANGTTGQVLTLSAGNVIWN